MPIHESYDPKLNKCYYQWGDQKRYYFTTDLGKKRAHTLAVKQMIAILRIQKLTKH